MLRIEIDRSLCSGFGSCAELAPDTFAIGGDGVADVLVAETGDGDVVEVARACPMGAIAVVDAETGERVA
jgi:ferredoxin